MTEEARKSTENAEERRASLGRSKYTDNILPLARIKKIMKMDPNITDNINVEANYVVCTATEMFVRWLSKEVYELDTKALGYKELAKFVQNAEKLDFLHQIIPHKITVKEYKKIISDVIEKEKNIESSGSDVSSSSEEEEEESGSEEEEADNEEESIEEISDSDDDEKNKSSKT